MKMKKNRPVNLDLQTIRFPLTAIASITHRVTGVITFVALAILLWLLNLSLSSPEGFELASSYADSFFVRFVLWGILSALAYHLVGGIRHAFMEMGFCEELASGYKSAKITFIVAGVLSVLAGVLVW